MSASVAAAPAHRDDPAPRPMLKAYTLFRALDAAVRPKLTVSGSQRVAQPARHAAHHPFAPPSPVAPSGNANTPLFDWTAVIPKPPSANNPLFAYTPGTATNGVGNGGDGGNGGRDGLGAADGPGGSGGTGSGSHGSNDGSDGADG